MMKASLDLVEQMHFVGTTDNGHTVHFDTSPENGGTGSAASPMQMMLQSVAACSAIDIVSILQKRRKHIGHLHIDMTAERADTYPRVFTSIHLCYTVTSTDVTESELERAIVLSQEQYCSASAVLQRSGCTLTWEHHITRPA